MDDYSFVFSMQFSHSHFYCVYADFYYVTLREQYYDIGFFILFVLIYICMLHIMLLSNECFGWR